VQGITAMREYPRLTELLLSRGHSEERVRKVIGGNLLRVYSAAWRT
jgi:membrane dipeptidase